jgi:GTP-binding protein HflX
VVSALTGEGVNDLLNGIEARLSANHTAFDLELPPEDGEGLSWLYAQTQIISREDSDDGMKLSVRVAPERAERLLRRFPDARKSGPERSTARRRGTSRGL